MTGQVSR